MTDNNNSTTPREPISEADFAVISIAENSLNPHEWAMSGDGFRYIVAQYGKVATFATYGQAVAYTETLTISYVDSRGHAYVWSSDEGCHHERELFGNPDILVDCRNWRDEVVLVEIDERGEFVETIAHCITAGSAERQARKLARD
jgi:hypothetical protein